MEEGPYKISWKKLEKKLKTKRTWGKTELSVLMKDLLIETYEAYFLSLSSSNKG
jgi:hypothetical protein